MLSNVFSLFVAKSVSATDGCPPGFYPGGSCPDPSSVTKCCIASWHPECQESCAKSHCETGGGWWVPKSEYLNHPYTCEMRFNARLGARTVNYLNLELGHGYHDPLCTNPLLPCKFVEYNHQYSRGCPATKPEKNNSCGGKSITCDYDNESIRFQCSNGKWRVLYTRYCQLNGEQVANGYLRLNEDGCVSAICESGRVQFNDCSKGCSYWGRWLTPGYTAIDKNFQNKNDENNPRKYVTYRCDYTNSFHTNSGVGCRKDGVNYLDGFIMAEKEANAGIKLLWTCHNGHVQTLGGPGALKKPAGAVKIGYQPATPATPTAPAVAPGKQ